MSTESDDATVLRLLERIRQRIAPAQASREDHELLEQFRPLPHERNVVEADDVVQQIDELRRLRHVLPAFPDSSRVPGGRLFHRLVGKSVRRDTALLAERFDALARLVAESLDALLEALRDPVERLRASQEAVLKQQDRLEARVTDHHGWIEARKFRPGFSSMAFAARFRGTRDEILLRYADVADLLVATGGPVLDLGCGRGELIELVMAKGGTARGVEVDPELVDYCRSIYLDVTECSATEALEKADDESLGAIALIQVVEHLTPDELAHIVPLALRKLKVGGLLVAETVNGTSPFVFTRSFFCDPTHTNPVHHEYLEFLLQQSGFIDVRVEWRSLVDRSDRLPEISEEPYRAATPVEEQIVKDTNSRLQMLDRFLFGPQDYLIVARK